MANVPHANAGGTLAENNELVVTCVTLTIETLGQDIWTPAGEGA